MFQRLCIHVIQRLRPAHAHLYLQPGMEDGCVSFSLIHCSSEPCWLTLLPSCFQTHMCRYIVCVLVCLQLWWHGRAGGGHRQPLLCDALRQNTAVNHGARSEATQQTPDRILRLPVRVCQNGRRGGSHPCIYLFIYYKSLLYKCFYFTCLILFFN